MSSRGGSEPRLELNFRFEISSKLEFEQAYFFFSFSNSKFIIEVCRARQKPEPNFKLKVNKTNAR